MTGMDHSSARAGARTSADILVESGDSLVLASGGLDSSTLLMLARAKGSQSAALFLDYGQAAAEAEEAAVTAICTELDAHLRVVRYEGTRFAAGEIRGRNAFLLHVALLEFPAAFGAVLIGIHSGTGYTDCSPEFVDLMQRSFDFHTGGAVVVAAPFSSWTKREVFNLALDLGVPVRRTYSCEAGNEPCGRCSSCLDRLALPAEELPK